MDSVKSADLHATLPFCSVSLNYRKEIFLFFFGYFPFGSQFNNQSSEETLEVLMFKMFKSLSLLEGLVDAVDPLP